MSLSPKSLLLATSFAAIVAAPCFLGEGNARAQAAPLTNYPACTAKPTPQDSEAAHSAFLLGKRFFEESDYASASHNFMDAFKLDCTKPDLLLNIARATELLGNRAEAVHALETYMQLSQTLGPEDRAQLQRRIDNLKAAIAAAAPPPPPTPTVVVPVATTPPPPPAPPPADEERHHTAWPWVVVGVGGAAAIAGGVLFFVGAGDVSTAEQTCPNAVCPRTTSKSTSPSAAQVANAENLDTTGNTLRTVGSVVFWSGLAVAGGGVLWHFLEPTGPATPSKTSFTPVLAPGYSGFAAVGTF